MGKLDGKTAIVTGAGRGVGRAIALKLGSEGARIVVNDLDLEPAKQVGAELGRNGTAFHIVSGDVAAPTFPEQLVSETLDTFNSIDIIINNAGYIWNTAAHKTSDKQWQAMLDVHATAPFRILRAAAPYIREHAKAEIAQAGHAQTRKIVNISSVSGLYGAATQIAYAAGKSALVGLTKTLAKEWGRFNVTVNCVAFGYIETRLTQTLTDGPRSVEISGQDYKVGLNAESIAQIAASTALQRAGTPEEAAGAVYLLCLPESDFITGHILECSGGYAG